ncbi:hypothetical protein [Rhizobium wenxiniae]|uniref:hypothetical protein n=1 Tax=Rhizobium wenxiniae TaxID=1737357 RepID=UPI003C145AF4
MGDQRGAEIETALDFDARLFQRLRVDFRYNELFGEVFAPNFDGLGIRGYRQTKQGDGCDGE